MTRKERFDGIISYFSKHQIDAQTELEYEDPYELLVSVILSAQCTDKRVNMTTPAFFEKFPDAKTLSWPVQSSPPAPPLRPTAGSPAESHRAGIPDPPPRPPPALSGFRPAAPPPFPPPRSGSHNCAKRYPGCGMNPTGNACCPRHIGWAC